MPKKPPLLDAAAVYRDRVAALLDVLAGDETGPKPVDAMLISALPNIRYLSGFTGSNALLVVSRESVTLFTDPRYAIQAAAQAPFDVRVPVGALTPAVRKFVALKKFRRLGFERNRLSFETFDVLKSSLPASCELSPVQEAVESLRMVKTEAELALIRESVQSNSQAFRRASRHFRHGMRESEWAAEIDYQQRRVGGDAPAFETIVAAGPRSALPHARPTSGKIGKGILLADLGALQDGYCSDMTRTMHVGKAPRRFKELYRAVLEAQLAAVAAVRPGVSAAKVDQAARQVLEKSGFGDNFVHSTGHGLGLEIHETPRIGKKSEAILRAGFVITIEPGAYFEGYGGIRIEDTLAVTETGSDVLTPTSKELAEW